MAVRNILSIWLFLAASFVSAQQFFDYQFLWDTYGFTNPCLEAINTTIRCPRLLVAHSESVPTVHFLGQDPLIELCTPACELDLRNLHDEISTSCSVNDTMTYQMNEYPATWMIDRFNYVYNMSCYRSSDTGAFCDLELKGQREQLTTWEVEEDCSDCNLGIWRRQLESPFGYKEEWASEVSSLASVCSVTKFEIATHEAHYGVADTSTELTTSTMTAVSLTTEITTSTSVTPPYQPQCPVKYTIQAGDTCESIAEENGADTFSILRLNNFNYCPMLPFAGSNICLPLPCKVHKLQHNENCQTLEETYDVSVDSITSWNPVLGSSCQNIKDLPGWYICISAPKEPFSMTASVPAHYTTLGEGEGPVAMEDGEASVQTATKTLIGPMALTSIVEGGTEANVTSTETTTLADAGSASMENTEVILTNITENPLGSMVLASTVEVGTKTNITSTETTTIVIRTRTSTVENIATVTAFAPSTTTMITNLTHQETMSQTSVDPATPTSASTWSPRGPVPSPSNAASDSSTTCIRWYTARSGDTCLSVTTHFNMTIADLKSWNPTLKGLCPKLRPGVAYCIEALSAVAFYPGYPTYIRTTEDSGHNDSDSDIIISSLLSGGIGHGTTFVTFTSKLGSATAPSDTTALDVSTVQTESPTTTSQDTSLSMKTTPGMEEQESPAATDEEHVAATADTSAVVTESSVNAGDGATSSVNDTDVGTLESTPTSMEGPQPSATIQDETTSEAAAHPSVMTGSESSMTASEGTTTIIWTTFDDMETTSFPTNTSMETVSVSVSYTDRTLTPLSSPIYVTFPHTTFTLTEDGDVSAASTTTSATSRLSGAGFTVKTDPTVETDSTVEPDSASIISTSSISSAVSTSTISSSVASSSSSHSLKSSSRGAESTPVSSSSTQGELIYPVNGTGRYPIAPATLDRCAEYQDGVNMTRVNEVLDFFGWDFRILGDLGADLDSCAYIARTYRIPFPDFLEWNPSLPAHNCRLDVDYSYCARKEPMADANLDSCDNRADHPGAVAPIGTTTDCDCHAVVYGADASYYTCERMQMQFGISMSAFLAMNPWVGTADCTAALYSNLGAIEPRAVCVGTHTPVSGVPRTDPEASESSGHRYASISSSVRGLARRALAFLPESATVKFTAPPGDSDARVDVMAKSNDVMSKVLKSRSRITRSARHGFEHATPEAPVHSGTDVEGCLFWHTVVDGDECRFIARQYGLDDVDFLRWNWGVGKECEMLQAGHAVCVGRKDRIN